MLNELLKNLGFGNDQQKTNASSLSVSQISVTEAHRRATAGVLILIDVRKQEEWNEIGRPQGSYGVTLQDEDFVQKVMAILGDKTQRIAVSCLAGSRSSQAAKKLTDANFSNVFDVEGGFTQWQKQNLPIDTNPFHDA